MTALDFLLLVLAGLGGGLAGSIAGLASLVTYPALLAAGLAPVAANVTNTVALVATGAGSTLGSRPELTGQRVRLVRLGGLAILGGASGGAALLIAPAGSFALAVPWLIGAASLAILLRSRVDRARAGDVALRTRDRRIEMAIFVVAGYGGYFGAAAGVMMLALLMAITGESLARSNAAKNLLLGLANAVAAVAFVAFGPVHWSFALPLAIGLFAGGVLGPRVVRHAPAGPLRVVIALAGVGLAVHLGLDTYR